MAVFVLLAWDFFAKDHCSLSFSAHRHIIVKTL
jgi:hypothetical protein